MHNAIKNIDKGLFPQAFCKIIPDVLRNHKVRQCVTLTADVLNLKSTVRVGKGINYDADIVVSGGTLNVVTMGSKSLSSPKGLKSDTDIPFSGGSTYGV